MSDLDFDELDKAVNSLVGDTPSSKEKTEAPAAIKPDEIVPKVETTTPAVTLPSRRTGRFMDMKHDGSSMKKDSSPSLMTSTKTNIEPLDSNIQPTATADIPVKPNTQNDTEDKPDEAKKTSPFLDDAKVEKRPLGGLESALDTESDLKKEAADIKDSDTKDGSEEKSAEAPPEPIELPPELDKDLVAIEADEAPVAGVPAPKVESETENNKEQEEPKAADTKDHKEEVSQLLASAASGSIPDQYKRENRSHELGSSHPLFDAEHFKDSPSSSPKKPKSTVIKILQWIFISLGLLLLGGSLGAAVFVFVSSH